MITKDILLKTIAALEDGLDAMREADFPQDSLASTQSLINFYRLLVQFSP